jgi:hypothetical protein
VRKILGNGIYLKFEMQIHYFNCHFFWRYAVSGEFYDRIFSASQQNIINNVYGIPVAIIRIIWVEKEPGSHRTVGGWNAVSSAAGS